jgi:hypothetical protein
VNGDEFMLLGGLKALDGSHSDIYLTESGPSEEYGVPMTLELGIVTGNASIRIVECSPDDIEKLGKWLIGVSQEVKARNKK